MTFNLSNLLMSKDIHIKPGQSAEPNECGSCRYFYRHNDTFSGAGTCGIRLPKKIPWRACADDEGSPILQKDTDGCDFWKVLEFNGKPVEFHQERVWVAGTPSK